MPRAVIFGGTGMIGRAIALRMLAAGWDVTVTGRDAARMPAEATAAGARFIAAERADPAQLGAALAGGADLLVDCACYTAAAARLLLPLLPSVGSAVMLSSKAVYVDAGGRHSNSDAPPDFGGPIRETQPTMAPAGSGCDYNSREGYGANKVAAERVLLDSGWPVTVLRPSKVHGQGSPRPREWVFVRRVLDGRPAVFLARRGRGVDHTTAAANIAALAEVVAARPGCRVLNCADPDAPSAREIAATVARHLGHCWEEMLLGDEAGEDGLGAHPWDVRHPIVLDMTAAGELGYVPAGDYAATVAAEIDWLVSETRGGSRLPPGFDEEYFAPLFDYAREDRYLAARG